MFYWNYFSLKSQRWWITVRILRRWKVENWEQSGLLVVLGRHSKSYTHCPGSALLCHSKWNEEEKGVLLLSHSMAAISSCWIDSWFSVLMFGIFLKCRTELCDSPHIDRMTKIEIIYWLFFGNHWECVFVHSFSCIQSLPGDLLPWYMDYNFIIWV